MVINVQYCKLVEQTEETEELKDFSTFLDVFRKQT